MQLLLFFTFAPQMKGRLKSIITIFVLSLFLVNSFSSLFIYASYYINKDYITQVFCENQDKPEMSCEGKCHLQKELDKEQEKEHSSKIPTNVKNEINLFSETVFKIDNSFVQDEGTDINQRYVFAKPRLFANSIFHPPLV